MSTPLIDKSMEGLLGRMQRDITGLMRRGARRSLSGPAAARDQAFPPPTNTAESAALANQRVSWFNTETGWAESYFATTGTTGLTVKGLLAGVPSGWYPIGLGPYQRLQPTALFTTSANVPVRNWNGIVDRNGGDGWFTYDNATGRVTVVQGGRYRISVWTTRDGGGSSVSALRRNGDVIVDGPAIPTNADYTLISCSLALPVMPGQYFDLFVVSSPDVHQGSAGTIRGEFSVEYLGPALVSD